MKGSSRVASIALAVVALALTATGVTLAASDANPSGYSRDYLDLNGYPPKSTALQIVASSGHSFDLTARVAVNFSTNEIEVLAQVPLLFSAVPIEVRLVHHHLYATTSNLSSVLGAPWLATVVKPYSLYGLALEMTKPDVALIRGFDRTTITKSGASTTYHFHGQRATAPVTGLPFAVPAGAAVDLAITVGSQGEFTGSSFTVHSARSTFSLSATVLSYNQPTLVSAPPVHDVKLITASMLRSLLRSTGLGTVLGPLGVTSLGPVRL